VEPIWTFLSDPNNQQTLAWLGGGLVVVAGGLWAVIKFLFHRSSGSGTPPSQTISADGGGIAAGGNVAIDRRKGMSGIEVALLVAVALGGVLLAVAWLIPQDTPAILENTEAIRQTAVRHDPPHFHQVRRPRTEMATRIKVSLPSSYPYKQDLARFAGRALALPP
jgi:hypothetical protein